MTDHRRVASAVALISAAALAMLGAACNEDAVTLKVLAAASLSEAMRDYATDFERRHPDVDVAISFGGSDLLAAQVRSGAPVDVYAAADETLPRRLAADGLLATPRAFARNELVIAVPAADARVSSPADLADDDVRLALAAPSVPAGAYARDALSALDRTDRGFSRAALRNVRTEEPDVRGVLAKVRERAVDGGIVYRTDLLAAGDGVDAVEIPARAQPRIAYAAGAVASSRHADLSRSFVAGLAGTPGRDALRSNGCAPMR